MVVGDDVGEMLGTCSVVAMIGERLGLNSPESMGLYLPGGRAWLTDESRNCISKLPAAGLGHDAAVRCTYC